MDLQVHDTAGITPHEVLVEATHGEVTPGEELLGREKAVRGDLAASAHHESEISGQVDTALDLEEAVAIIRGRPFPEFVEAQVIVVIEDVPR